MNPDDDTDLDRFKRWWRSLPLFQWRLIQQATYNHPETDWDEVHALMDAAPKVGTPLPLRPHQLPPEFMLMAMTTYW